jgi:assimilatory nitrate reductase catalytic subunit
MFAEDAIGSAARRFLLAGILADGPPPSPTICVCHGVAAAAICAAIGLGARSTAAVGEATRAGTGCGSCRPEIAALLAGLPEAVPEPV